MSKVKCEYCGSYIPDTEPKCPYCGAMNKKANTECFACHRPINVDSDTIKDE